MMNGKQKLYFLLNRLEDVREITPSGQSLKIHATRNLNNKYKGDELSLLFAKLEQEEKVIITLKVGNRIREAGAMYGLNEPDDGSYHIELLPAFDDYFLKIQNEPEYQEFMGKTPKKIVSQLKHDLSVLHPEIFAKCQSLFEKAEYPEAVEKGFKIVRDRLRDLTGYETGSKAFGNTKLHIKGAVASNVDHDFNEGVKFLTMAIDMFRNEKSHTSDAKIDDPQRAYEYLSLSSLAMNLLDQAEIKTTI